MFDNTKAFSGFSVNDLQKAKSFYQDILGLQVNENQMGLIILLAGTTPVFVYAKPDHVPASFTILNFPVDDIAEAVSELKTKGVTFEQYPGTTDEDGIAHGKSKNMGPDIAWFKDPSGNILSVLEEA